MWDWKSGSGAPPTKLSASPCPWGWLPSAYVRSSLSISRANSSFSSVVLTGLGKSRQACSSPVATILKCINSGLEGGLFFPRPPGEHVLGLSAALSRSAAAAWRATDLALGPSEIEAGDAGEAEAGGGCLSTKQCTTPTASSWKSLTTKIQKPSCQLYIEVDKWVRHNGRKRHGCVKAACVDGVDVVHGAVERCVDLIDRM